MDIRKKITMRVLRHRNRLPRGIVDALLLQVFEVGLDGALHNLIWWKISPGSRRLGLGDL